MKPGLALACISMLLALGTARAQEDACTKNHYILDFPCQASVLRDWGWSDTGALNDPRTGHSATLLEDGRVMAAGGSVPGGGGLASVEAFDPASGTWTRLASMNAPRNWHAAVRLGDGRVLVTGNVAPMADDLGILPEAEIYDPRKDQWTVVGGPGIPRASHSLTLLSDGTVLAAGGVDNFDTPIAIAEIFDPRTERWERTAGLNVARFNHTATRLPDGKVLVTGGSIDDFLGIAIADAEVFDPATREWMPAKRLSVAREWHKAILLRDGEVLVVGGYAHVPMQADHGATYQPTSYAEVDGFGAGGWTRAPAMQMARMGHGLASLPAGMVLASGGKEWGSGVAWWRNSASTEIYDPAKNRWVLGPPMRVERSMHTATALDDGRVLVIGGYASGNQGALDPARSSAEVFGPARGSAMGVARAGRR